VGVLRPWFKKSLCAAVGVLRPWFKKSLCAATCGCFTTVVLKIAVYCDLWVFYDHRGTKEKKETTATNIGYAQLLAF